MRVANSVTNQATFKTVHLVLKMTISEVQKGNDVTLVMASIWIARSLYFLCSLGWACLFLYDIINKHKFKESKQ